MQDAAPPHWGLNVPHFLEEQLPNRWIGRGSQSMPWPPRSQDLTLCDFFLWGFVKSKLYAERPQNIQKLKLKTENVFRNDLTADMCSRVLQEYQQRLRKCIENVGGHGEF